MSDYLAEMRAAYDESGRSWTEGPARMYDVLAAELVSLSPKALRGSTMVDVGAGTGAASRALLGVGARVIAVDASSQMLAVDAARRPPAVVGMAGALPFGDASVDGVVAAFCFNHLEDPSVAVAEAARVVRPGGVLMASVFSAANDHPAKAVVEDLAGRRGWRRPEWYSVVKGAEESLGTADAVVATFARAGQRADVREARVDVGITSPEELAAWRLGMAHIAPWFGRLPEGERAALTAEILREMPAQPLRPAVLFISSQVAA